MNFLSANGECCINIIGTLSVKISFFLQVIRLYSKKSRDPERLPGFYKFIIFLSCSPSFLIIPCSEEF
ncbi:MAG: hypothetical protein C4554_07080 [Dethiobacter sp.]|jgi:hypothetical protein|nr:MAG: hypothetical protein C4554_07080 [Dethiobacter sp.]